MSAAVAEVIERGEGGPLLHELTGAGSAPPGGHDLTLRSHS